MRLTARVQEPFMSLPVNLFEFIVVATDGDRMVLVLQFCS